MAKGYRQKDQGMTLIEIAIALAIFSIGIVFVIKADQVTQNYRVQSEERQQMIYASYGLLNWAIGQTTSTSDSNPHIRLSDSNNLPPDPSSVAPPGCHYVLNSNSTNYTCYFLVGNHNYQVEVDSDFYNHSLDKITIKMSIGNTPLQPILYGYRVHQ